MLPAPQPSDAHPLSAYATIAPKHDINVEILQKSPAKNLVNTNDVNLGFNTYAAGCLVPED
jgi:hypothetical protein